MGDKLAIIHTTPATIDTMKQLASELMPGIEIVNIMDDSILPELRDNGGRLEAVESRWLSYAHFAEQIGANCVLSACSSVGPLVSQASRELSIPVLRIDEAMAETAIEKGKRIGVCATLQTTLGPTTELLKEKAQQAGKTIAIVPLLVSEAYQRLQNGDPEGHDTLLAQRLEELAKDTDIVVLAQASMARVIPRLPKSIQSRFVTSPRMGMERTAKVLAGLCRP